MVDRLAFKHTSRTNQQADKQGRNDRDSQPQPTVGFCVVHDNTLGMDIGNSRGGAVCFHFAIMLCRHQRDALLAFIPS